MLYFVLLVIAILVIFLAKKASSLVSGCRYSWVHQTKYFKTNRFGVIRVTPGHAMVAVLFSAVSSVVLAAVFSPIYWEFPPNGGVVVAIDENSVIRDSSSTFGIPDLPWGKNQIMNISRQAYKIEVAIQPITTNPKVRHIISRVWARISDEQTYLLSGRDALGKQVESAIYEFHEKYSVELGTLYNPHSQPQQKKFYELVANGLAPDLAKKGIEVVGAEFRM